VGTRVVAAALPCSATESIVDAVICDRDDDAQPRPGGRPVVVDQFSQWFGTDPVVHGLVGGLVIAGLNLVGASLMFV
jgi:hypothetical protein